MVETIKAENINLMDLSEKFGLERTEDDKQFFREFWQIILPELTEAEKQVLDEVKADYRHLSKYPGILDNGNRCRVGTAHQV